MLSQDSEDEIRSRFVFELAIWLGQDELNPRVRCAFGNVFSASLSSKFKVKWNFLREEYTVAQYNKNLNTAVKLYFDKVGNVQSYSNV